MTTWMDKPDGEGWWWVRDCMGWTDIRKVEMGTRDPTLPIDVTPGRGGGVIQPDAGTQWARAVPPPNDAPQPREARLAALLNQAMKTIHLVAHRAMTNEHWQRLAGDVEAELKGDPNPDADRDAADLRAIREAYEYGVFHNVEVRWVCHVGARPGNGFSPAEAVAAALKAMG